MENSYNLQKGNFHIKNHFDILKENKLSNINPISAIQKNINKYINGEEDIISNIKKKKYNEKIESHKKYIFQQNLGNKINILIKSNETTISKPKKQSSCIKPENQPLDEYIKNIKQKYKEDPVYFESMNKTNNIYHYLFSLCFFCQHPVVACDDKVVCVNGCYNMDVKTREFNNDYTLDKFLNDHYDFTSDHLICNGDIIPVYVDNEEQYAFFICTVCDKKVFDKAGVKL